MVIPAIELVEECASPVEFERATLRELDAAIGFDCAFFFTVDSAPTALGLPPEFASAVRESARALRYDREMEPVKAAALAERGVAIDSDVLGESRRRCAYFRDFAEPVGGLHSLLAYLRVRGEVVASVMLGRCRQSFCAHEVRAIEELLPSLAVARASYGVRRPVLDSLSPRERELVQYLCLGYTNREIAAACGTSANTVRNQLVSAFQKLGASTRAEAVGIARG